MKKIFPFLLLLLVTLSTSELQAKNLWAFLTWSTFNSPEGPYIETYLSVAGNSVAYIKKDNGKFQATVNILMTFKQDKEIKAFKKYELYSSEVDDTTNNNLYFVDQQRIAIPNGTYDFEIQLSDKNKTAPAVPYSQALAIDFPKEKPSISGIELVKSYTKAAATSELTKSGYDLVPYTYTFYPEIESKMTFYAELYNMDKAGQDDKFLLSYYIESFESNMKLGQYARVKKEAVKGVNVLLAEFSIENLASGNYNLVIEARDQKNEIITSKKIFFQRMNPKAQVSMEDVKTTEIVNTFAEQITNRDTLKEFISCTYPVATGLEKAFMRESLKKADIKTMQQFFYSYWYQRDPKNPEKAWQFYKVQVHKVQVNFGTPVKKGYQTDRGRVYLEYGPPNTRSTHYSEPSNYPYEIWQYYTMNNNQRNRKFIFFSPDMVTSDFFLLHSDATGEINNPRWKVDLRNRIYSTSNLQDTQVIESWGNMQQDYWDLPN